MKFAKTGHNREDHQELSVSFLVVVHALRLEFEKSMELTASSHRSCFLCCSRECRDEAALPEEVSTGARMKERWRV